MNLKLKKISIFLFIFSIILLFSGCNSSLNETISKLTINPSIVKINSNPHKLIVHYIDVGQGDSALIQINNKNLLIDAGPKDAEDKVLSYIKAQGVTKLDYIIATHPHEDHIGGMATILKNFKVGEFIAPKIYNPPNTSNFKDLISTLKTKNMKINVLNPGNHINLGESVQCQVLAPSNSLYDNLNNYSIVLKITYKNSKFLFNGDAEQESEKQILNNGFDVSCDVLKVGHHGSKSSTGEDFLREASPKISIISCGKNNDYGHPHKATLDKLNSINSKIYRTDLHGDIVLASDGDKIKILK